MPNEKTMLRAKLAEVEKQVVRLEEEFRYTLQCIDTEMCVKWTPSRHYLKKLERCEVALDGAREDAVLFRTLLQHLEE